MKIITAGMIRFHVAPNSDPEYRSVKSRFASSKIKLVRKFSVLSYLSITIKAWNAAP
jgi:hypothetical protein